MIVGLLGKDSVFNGANCPGFIIEAESQLLKPLLTLLNSRLITYHMRAVCPPKLGGYIRLNATNINEIPVKLGSPSQQGELTALADEMIVLHKRHATEHLPQRREQLQREIDATDRQIDQTVFRLYGLTTEEIAIVESTTVPAG